MSHKPFNRIKVALVEREIKNKELAKKLGVTESTVSRWCGNETQPSVNHFYEIAEYLGVDIRDLIVSTKS